MATRLTRSIAAALVCSAFGSTAASAQNYEAPGVLRFGVHGQGTFVDADLTVDGTTTAAAIDKAGFGASFGYDWRMDRVMIGVEADVTTVSDSLKARPESVAVDYLSTVRGRLGWFATPRVLLYATGGLAALHGAYEPNTARREADIVTGWTAGGGAEYNISDMSFFAEYLRTDFGLHKWNSAQGALPVESQADIARVGVKFKIGFDY